MALALDVLGAVLWITFGALGLLGAGLIVAGCEAVLDRKRHVADSAGFRDGRCAALRRYAIYWAVAAALWATAVLATIALRAPA